MVIRSTRLGQLEVSADDVLEFPGGLPGFPRETSFAFVPHGSDSPFSFLQSASEPDLTFLVVEPFTFFNDYEFDLTDDYLEELAVKDAAQVKVLNIVSVPEKAEEMTANLLAPIIVNRESRQARQIVLEKTPFTTRHRLFPQGFPKKSDKGEK